MIYRRILFVTDPPGSQRGGGHSFPDVGTIGDDITSFDLCGRSWADAPKNWSELIFSTFKPIFCHGRKASDPIEGLLEQIIWLQYQRPSFSIVTRSGSKRIALEDLAWDGISLLVICSKKVLRDLIGQRITDIYSYHARRDDERDEKGPLAISEVWKSSHSLLFFLPKNFSEGIELVVLPEPSIGGKRDIKGVRLSVERFEELRQDYVRSIHSALGCERHALW